MNKKILDIKVKEIRQEKKIPIQEILDFMGWSNRSVLHKKETGSSKVTMEEGLKLSIVLKEPIHKIFCLKSI